MYFKKYIILGLLTFSYECKAITRAQRRLKEERLCIKNECALRKLQEKYSELFERYCKLIKEKNKLTSYNSCIREELSFRDIKEFEILHKIKIYEKLCEELLRECDSLQAEIEEMQCDISEREACLREQRKFVRIEKKARSEQNSFNFLWFIKKWSTCLFEIQTQEDQYNKMINLLDRIQTMLNKWLNPTAQTVFDCFLKSNFNDQDEKLWDELFRYLPSLKNQKRSYGVEKCQLVFQALRALVDNINELRKQSAFSAQMISCIEKKIECFNRPENVVSAATSAS